MSSIHKVTVLGTGVLGSQIAFQTAFSGFDVVAYDISDEILEKAKSRFSSLAETYKQDGVAGAAEGKAEKALENLTYSSDLADAVKDADLVIEAIPEVLKLKQETYEKLAEVAPGSAVLCRLATTGEGADWPLSRKFGCVPAMAVDVLRHARALGLDAYGVSFHVG